MTNNSNDFDDLSNKLNDQERKLNNLEKMIDSNNSETLFEEEISLLKNELFQIKEINKKTKDFLLLEIESSLDKYNQKQNNDTKHFLL